MDEQEVLVEEEEEEKEEEVDQAYCRWSKDRVRRQV